MELDRRAGTVGISWKNEERFIVALDQGLRVVGERSRETGNLHFHGMPNGVAADS